MDGCRAFPRAHARTPGPAGAARPGGGVRAGGRRRHRLGGGRRSRCCQARRKTGLPRARLALDPLLAYDSEHGTELVGNGSTFLPTARDRGPRRPRRCSCTSTRSGTGFRLDPGAAPAATWGRWRTRPPCYSRSVCGTHRRTLADARAGGAGAIKMNRCSGCGCCLSRPRRLTNNPRGPGGPRPRPGRAVPRRRAARRGGPAAGTGAGRPAASRAGRPARSRWPAPQRMVAGQPVEPGQAELGPAIAGQLTEQPQPGQPAIGVDLQPDVGGAMQPPGSMRNRCRVSGCSRARGSGSNHSAASGGPPRRHNRAGPPRRVRCPGSTRCPPLPG